MRCFVGITVAEPIRTLLLKVQDALRRAEGDVKWVDEAQLHLTLKFLGDLTEDAVSTLRARLTEEAVRWPRMALTYAGTGAFPEKGELKVIWAGCTGDIDKLAGLAAAIERHAESVGVPAERRPFVAHLTLGRVKSARNLHRLREAIAQQRQVPLGKDEVAGFVLFKSTLTSQGPIYERIAEFGLRTAD